MMSAIKGALWFKIAKSVAVIYALWLTAGYFLHAKLIYPTYAIDPARQRPPPPEARVLKRAIKQGDVEAWFFPANSRDSTDSKSSTNPTIIMTHGNGELIDDNIERAKAFNMLGYNVLMPEFRGYGRSAGSPTEKGIKEDILYFWNQLVGEQAIRPEKAILVGFSLGGGVALSIASEIKPQAVVLHFTFTGISAYTKKYLIPSVILTSKYDNVKNIQALDVPVFLAHGTRDEIVPFSHGQRLKEVYPRTQFYQRESGHNDFPFDEDYWRTVANFLAQSTK